MLNVVMLSVVILDVAIILIPYRVTRLGNFCQLGYFWIRIMNF
jgi:hypothetical protein